MALNKSITLDNGCVVNYHRISNISLHMEDNVCAIVCVDSYVNQEYRKIERPVTTNHFTVDMTVEEEESTGIRALMYSKLKKLSYWDGCSDC